LGGGGLTDIFSFRAEDSAGAVPPGWEIKMGSGKFLNRLATGLALSLVAGACVGVFGWTASAQDQACRYYKVQANSLNISKEPRGDAVFIDVLDKGEVVCATRTEKVGDRDWVYIPHKYPKPNERAPVEGWTNPRLLQQLSATEAAAATGPLGWFWSKWVAAGLANFAWIPVRHSARPPGTVKNSGLMARVPLIGTGTSCPAITARRVESEDARR
jgi:hypothetical protein